MTCVCPLSFTTTHSLCHFIKTINLKNFLLLGKDCILIALLTDNAIALAKEKFGAAVIDTPEISRVVQQHYSQKADALFN
jgi:hypothetical protein